MTMIGLKWSNVGPTVGAIAILSTFGMTIFLLFDATVEDWQVITKPARYITTKWTQMQSLVDKETTEETTTTEDPNIIYEYNNLGPNVNLKLDTNRQRNASDTEMKHILFWNGAYGDKKYGFGFGRQPFYDNQCPETRCITTEDRGTMNVEDFDAIVIHQRALNWNDVPGKRKPHQRYIDFIAEAAQYQSDPGTVHKMDGFFNWTLTFRMDSDFPYPYGWVTKVKQHPENLEAFIQEFGKTNAHLAEGKSKHAAWFVTNCHTPSKRETLVNKMKDFGMNVDIFGRCGTHVCSRSNETQCYAMVDRQYWFYLSFENSYCGDYFTEKFFNIMALNRTIPVTFNNVVMESRAPPHSYIDATKFNSTLELVDYMKKVMNDKELYASYFWWKDFYSVRGTSPDKNQAFCDICKALHNPSLPPKVYRDLNDWWNGKSNCSTPIIT